MPASFYDDGSAGTPQTAQATKPWLLNNAAAGNGTPFNLSGGLYAIATVATGTGTIDLQILGPDGSTWIAAMTQITATSKFQTQQLPPGSYRWATASFTAIYASVARIPQA